MPPLPRDDFALGVLTVMQREPGEEGDGETPSAERMLALAGETLFPESPERVAAFRERFLATLSILDHPDFAHWVRDPGGGLMYLHPALLAAAAAARVNRNGHFALRRLAEQVDALAGADFADWRWPDETGAND